MEAAEEKILVLREDELCTIKVDLSISVLFVNCKQHMEQQDLRERFLEMLVIVDTYQVKYLLSNVRAMHYMKVEVTNWLSGTIIPCIKSSPLLKWARIEQPSSMMELNSIQLKKECGNDFQFESFLEEESALHWLLSAD
ncbi:hypothetical protein [Pontibacter anaerobius]|uniref:STAS/SEC14 domain-containing protein n=1 Tax=Pontibacter anaerobius TaxID=2993940 RepID=A0ABT3RH67_9BACT|nr:hypothetical protein [Pontibacter anaerobius]MCX2741125.1 hypothetical protein [Pontibacter anaerobius]